MRAARGSPGRGLWPAGRLWALPEGSRRWCVRALAVCLAGAWGLAHGVPIQAAEASLVPILVCEARGLDEVSLEVVLFAAGEGRTGQARLQVEFSDPAAGGAPFEGSAPRPRSRAIPVVPSDWQASHLAVVAVGSFTLDSAVPSHLQVRGGLEGEPLAELGTLERAVAGGPGQVPRLVRAWPGAALPTGRSPVWVSAAVVPVDGAGAVVVRLIFANCGESFPVDYDAFIHIETEATGEHLDRTTALGLHPMAAPTDSASWSAGELTIVDLGPFSLPADAPEALYLRAGLFDHRGGTGTRKRLPLAGPDTTDRALVGRLVTRAGATRFERILSPGEARP